MKPFTLFDEVYGWLRSDDDAPAISPVGKGEDVLDATQPFSELFAFSPSSGKAAELVKRVESADMLTKVLGSDLADALNTSPSTPSALDKRIAEISQRVVGNLLEKTARVTGGGPLRKRAIAGIVNNLKQDLVDRGYPAGVEHFGADGWDHLTAVVESFVSTALMA